MFGCSLPRSGRCCIRQVKEAKHTNHAKGTFGFIGNGRMCGLGRVRHCYGAGVGTRPVPSSSSITTVGTSGVLSNVKRVVRSKSLHSVVRLVRRRIGGSSCATVSVTTTFLGRTVNKIRLSGRSRRFSSTLTKSAKTRRKVMHLFVGVKGDRQVHPKSVLKTMTKRTGVPNGLIKTVSVCSGCAFIRIPRRCKGSMLGTVGGMGVGKGSIGIRPTGTQ